jgi:hypothetical protein
MSVTVRPYRRGGWQVDIMTQFPDGSRHRERRRLQNVSKVAARNWGQARERHLLQHGRPQPRKEAPAEAPTLEEFGPRFMDGHARANRQKLRASAEITTIEISDLTHYPPFREPSNPAVCPL